MYENLLIIGGILSILVAIITLVKFLFYTKSEVDKKLTDLKTDTDNFEKQVLQKFQDLQSSFKDELTNTKESIFNKLLEAERTNTQARQEIYNKLSESNQSFEEYNQHMLELVSQVKQDEKQTNLDFMQLLNGVKDELKSDYINRYNDLLRLVGTKTNNSDFDRLETKFDKLSQTMTELKTIVQLNLEEVSKHNH